MWRGGHIRFFCLEVSWSHGNEFMWRKSPHLRQIYGSFVKAVLWQGRCLQYLLFLLFIFLTLCLIMHNFRLYWPFKRTNTLWTNYDKCWYNICSWIPIALSSVRVHLEGELDANSLLLMRSAWLVEKGLPRCSWDRTSAQKFPSVPAGNWTSVTVSAQLGKPTAFPFKVISLFFFMFFISKY